MSEKQGSLLAEKQKDSPPTYEATAAQHGALPMRNGPPPAGAKSLPRGPFPLDIPVLNQLKGKRIILASASPRRKQLLATVHAGTVPLLAQLTFPRLASQTLKSCPPPNPRISQKRNLTLSNMSFRLLSRNVSTSTLLRLRTH